MIFPVQVERLKKRSFHQPVSVLFKPLSLTGRPVIIDGKNTGKSMEKQE